MILKSDYPTEWLGQDDGAKGVTTTTGMKNIGKAKTSRQDNYKMKILNEKK